MRELQALQEELQALQEELREAVEARRAAWQAAVRAGCGPGPLDCGLPRQGCPVWKTWAHLPDSPVPHPGHPVGRLEYWVGLGVGSLGLRPGL